MDDTNGPAPILKGKKKKFRSPSCPSRANMSFSNQRFMEIQRENQRLMNKLVKIRSDGDKRAINPGKKSGQDKKANAKMKKPAGEVDVRRQLEQMRIRNENISLVNRLLEIQPSEHLRADVLARDFRAHNDLIKMKRAISANSLLHDSVE